GGRRVGSHRATFLGVTPTRSLSIVIEDWVSLDFFNVYCRMGVYRISSKSHDCTETVHAGLDVRSFMREEFQ
ncbi:hypothetical protein J6590_083344, partial [Homalodisca vitripennis]